MASTTLAQFRTRIAAKTALSNTTAADQGMIDDLVNMAYEDVVRRTSCKVGTTTISLSASTGDYTIPTSYLHIMEVYTTTSGQSYSMQRTTAEDIIRRRIGVSTGFSSSPARYYATQGIDLLLVWPTPSAADSLSVYYVARPTALSASADLPSAIPAEFHQLIEYKACAEAADYAEMVISRGRMTPTVDPTRWLLLYEKGLKELRVSVSRAGGRRLAPVRINRRLTVPLIRSTDLGN